MSNTFILKLRNGRWIALPASENVIEIVKKQEGWKAISSLNDLQDIIQKVPARSSRPVTTELPPNIFIPKFSFDAAPARSSSKDAYRAPETLITPTNTKRVMGQPIFTFGSLMGLWNGENTDYIPVRRLGRDELRSFVAELNRICAGGNYPLPGTNLEYDRLLNSVRADRPVVIPGAYIGQALRSKMEEDQE
jgi:hypothetical protein